MYELRTLITTTSNGVEYNSLDVSGITTFDLVHDSGNTLYVFKDAGKKMISKCLLIFLGEERHLSFLC